jgi:hypothetical protein
VRRAGEAERRGRAARGSHSDVHESSTSTLRIVAERV